MEARGIQQGKEREIGIVPPFPIKLESQPVDSA